MRVWKEITHVMIAALLISGAAICALGQSGGAGRRPQAVEKTPAASDKNKTANVAQPQAKPQATPQASKQNEREPVAPPVVLAITKPTGAVRYSYEFTQPEFSISHILIQHDDNGRGEISFKRKDDDAAIVDPVELSPAALARIKGLWDALRFLDTEASYQSERQFPHLGTMRLGMTAGERERVAEFNWTSDSNASALVNEYRRIADQAMFVFNISVARQNQPLEAPKLLDELDKLYKRNGLSDPQQLLPLLRELSNDERIPLIARNHAGRLLKKIEK